MPDALPLLPTTVCGSHGLPSWLFLVREAVRTDRLGPAEIQEAYDDAVRLAIRDQVEAGVRMEVQALVAAGADFIQVDEPNYVMAAGKHRVVKGGPRPMVDALGAVLDGVRVKRALHVCFGNAHNNSFASPRRYRPLFPAILEAPVDQFVFEYANREMAEIELWGEFPSDKEVAAGVIDVKAFRVETPEEVALRVRLALKHIGPERLWLVPDCGLWETPRWVGVAKLRSLVEAARILRRELGPTQPQGLGAR